MPLQRSRALASSFVTDVLLASDADWVIEDVRAALSDPDVDVRVVRAGAAVRAAVAAATPDLVILDLQIGNMGGMATCLDLHLEAGAGRLPEVPVLMLLDRDADVFLARRSEADGWLVKPVNPFELRAAATRLLAGESMFDEPGSPTDPDDVGADDATDIDDTATDDEGGAAEVA